MDRAFGGDEEDRRGFAIVAAEKWQFLPAAQGESEWYTLGNGGKPSLTGE